MQFKCEKRIVSSMPRNYSVLCALTALFTENEAAYLSTTKQYVQKVLLCIRYSVQRIGNARLNCVMSFATVDC